MAYIVKAFTPGKLNLAPETLEEEVLQNVAKQPTHSTTGRAAACAARLYLMR